MDKILLDILMYLSEALFLYYYASTLYLKKYSLAKTIVGLMIVHCVLCVVYQLQIVVLNALLFGILYVLSFYLLFEVTIKTAVFQALIFIIVMFTSELAVMGIGTLFFRDFNAMDEDKLAYVYVIITSKLLFFWL